jgi:hypothetical protein
MHNLGLKFSAEFCDCHDSLVARQYPTWRFWWHMVGDVHTSLNIGQTGKFLSFEFVIIIVKIEIMELVEV